MKDSGQVVISDCWKPSVNMEANKMTDSRTINELTYQQPIFHN